MKRVVAIAVVVLCVPALLPAMAAAGAKPDAWQFDGTFYLYAPTTSSTTTFPQVGGGTGVSIDASTVNLNMAFMGTFEARKGHWGAFTDLMYLNVGDDKSTTHGLTVDGTPLPANVNADATLGLKAAVSTLAGCYRVQADARSPVDFFAGARLLDMKETFDWQLSGNIGSIPLPGRAGNQEAEVTNWDAIVGVRGRVALGAGRKWFIPYYLDFGGGESDQTWQAMAGVGYAFHWGDIVGAWRDLDYKMKSGKIENINFNGPAIAVVFHW